MMFAAALLCATPAYAQTPEPQADAVIDPARLAAARPVVDRVWPLGTYRRIMSTSMEQMTNSILGAALGMNASDVAEAAGDAKAAKDVGEQTLGETVRAADPAFDERMRISMRVMSEEMGALMNRIEPEVRDALARIIAKRFTVAEMGELGRFFATPAGSKYAAESMVLAVDPEMLAATMKLMPVFLQAMPAMEKKLTEATKHLPPPPKPKERSSEDATE